MDYIYTVTNTSNQLWSAIDRTQALAIASRENTTDVKVYHDGRHLPVLSKKLSHIAKRQQGKLNK